MPLDILPSKILVFTRDEIRDNYLRDYGIRNPAANVSAGQQPYIDASVIADTLVPVTANAVTIGNGLAVQTMSTAQLDNEIARLGSSRIGAQTASGYVLAQGSVGGGTIFAGDEIKTASGLRFQCTATAVYPPGAYVPIGMFTLGATDTGPGTNQFPNTVMTWSAPRPGISATALVATQSNGAGLQGGRNQETDSELVDRIIDLRANPPVSGNDAAYQAAILKAPGLSIQAAFTYPCIEGPGSTGFTFTLRPGSPGATRIPSTAQLAAVQAWLVGQFPKDDGILACTIAAQPVILYLQASWAPGAASWMDTTPWPLYVTSDPVLVLGAGTLSNLAARVGTAGTSTTTPQVGQNIAFYDQPNATFRQKRIKTVSVVSANVSWDLTFDTTNGASDLGYTPVVGQPCCPWSNSLQSLVPSLVAYFDGLGPGEQDSNLFDPGYRKRRSPFAPAFWPNTITPRVLQPSYAQPTIADVLLYSPTTPYAPTIGTPGVSSNMLTLGSIGVFQ